MNYTVKPSEKDIRNAKSVVKGVIETCRIIEEVDNLNVELGWTSEQFILKDLQGSQCFAKNGKVLKIGFNTTPKSWKDSLKYSSAIGYGKTLFLNTKNQDVEEIDFLWEELLFEGFAHVFANEALGDIKSKAPFDYNRFEDEELEELWRIFSKNLDKSMNSSEISSEILQDRNIEVIGHLICEELAKNYSWEELPDLEQRRLIEAGESLFI